MAVSSENNWAAQRACGTADRKVATTAVCWADHWAVGSVDMMAALMAIQRAVLMVDQMAAMTADKTAAAWASLRVDAKAG